MNAPRSMGAGIPENIADDEMIRPETLMNITTLKMITTHNGVTPRLQYTTTTIMTIKEHMLNTVYFPHESASLPINGAATMEKIPVIIYSVGKSAAVIFRLLMANALPNGMSMKPPVANN